MHSDSYNSRYLNSPSKKPVAGTLLKTYSHRPNSALRAKNDLDTSSHSPVRPEIKPTKKLSMTRYPTTSTSNRPYDVRSPGLRRKNEESLSSSSGLSKSTTKWDKHLNIETTGTPTNYSTLNLKGYSVTHNTSHMVQKSTINPMPNTTSSKYSSYDRNPGGSFTASNRGITPPSKASPIKKYSTSTSKGFGLSSNTPIGHSINERYDSTPKEEKRLYSSMYPAVARPVPYDDETPYIPPFDPTKCSVKQNGVIKAYAVNTHQGIVRNYNEDRVAIILNIMKPAHLGPNDEWPICSFFGVYDGHGGTTCADFLRDNLHQYVIQDKSFPKNPVEALRRGFEEAEKTFKEIAQSSRGEIDRSGSCAIVALIVEDMCYIANVGDSRAIGSFELGRKSISLSRDHKPNDKDEQKRILSYGGKIYQSQVTNPPGFPGPKVIYGPHRVFPGRLSVSRTFGDIEAKIPKYGGNPYVVVAEPEIKAYKVTKDWDYIVLASDGIYDKMETQDVANCIWNSAAVKESDVHKQTAIGVEKLMKESLIQKTLDNITVVMVSFSGFERANFNVDRQEDLRKSDTEFGSQAFNKSALNNSMINSQGDRYLNSQNTPVGNKTFTQDRKERPVYSAAQKRYESIGNRPDYSVSHSLDRSGGGFWRGNN